MLICYATRDGRLPCGARAADPVDVLKFFLQRGGHNCLDKRTLCLGVFRPGQARSKLAFQVVVSGCCIRMSPEIVTKREVLDPEVASFHHTMKMNRTRLLSRPVEVPSVRQLLFVFLDVLVAGSFECRSPKLNLGQCTHTNHHVDHWFCAEAGNSCTPNMLDDGFSSGKHGGENATFCFESARPVGIIRLKDDSFSHRLLLLPFMQFDS